MTIKQQIVEFLQSHPGEFDDDQITQALNLKHRMQANQRCRELADDGYVIRQKGYGKITNSWAGKQFVETRNNSSRKEISNDEYHQLWFWEGNVQEKLAAYLMQSGFEISSTANTASHEAGKDIVAEKDDQQLWVSIKGYPRGTARTNPALQCTHWFKDATFDMVRYREIDKNVDLAIGLPDYPKYHNLTKAIAWLKEAGKFKYYWVKQNGEIIEE